MIVDAFPFFNELDAYRARVELLRGEEVMHLISEGSHTHQGSPKPMYLDRLEPLPLHVCRVRGDLSGGGRTEVDNWSRESVQRDYLQLQLKGLLGAGTLDPDTLVISSDADELVNPQVLPELRSATARGPVIVRMRMIYYGRWEWPDGWFHAKALRLRDLPPSLSELRRRFDLPVVLNGGWHVSYRGNPDQLRTKVESFAHAENLQEQTWERIRTGRETGRGPNGERLEPLRGVELLPAPVRELLG